LPAGCYLFKNFNLRFCVAR